MNSQNLVEQFSTPPEQGETRFDRKAFAQETILDIKFENRILRAYSMGTGPNVLMIHGWGSRASHLVFIARYIAKNGFRVVVIDGPGHGNSKKSDCKNMSNMFEFGRAISCVAKSIGDIYAVVGHSLGAFASAFTMTGTGPLSEYKFFAQKLLLISSPISMTQVFENYCRKRDELSLLQELTSSLENALSFEVKDYDLTLVLKYLSSKIMIIHDEQDEVVPVNEVLLLTNKYKNILLKLTKGYGHQKILVNNEMLDSMRDFLKT